MNFSFRCYKDPIMQQSQTHLETQLNSTWRSFLFLNIVKLQSRSNSGPFQLHSKSFQSIPIPNQSI